jgi:hypothetical protein
MINNAAYVVGDEFENFAKNQNVFTFSNFITQLYTNKNKKFIDYLVLGQGLSESETKILCIVAKKENITILNDADLNIASTNLTHKCKVENILISEPVKTQEQIYTSKLFINDACAEMSDHKTGQHIQGMVLIEAARQMMLSVAEKYILTYDDQGKSYCALLKVNSFFNQFAFPIETEIKHIIHELQANGSGRYIAKTKTEIYQNQQMVAFVEIDYLFNNKEKLLNKEKGMAIEALETNIKLHLDKINSQLSQEVV